MQGIIAAQPGQQPEAHPNHNPFVTPYRPIVVPGFHPAYLLRGQEKYSGVLERDLARAARLAEIGWQQQEHVHICWHPDDLGYRRAITEYGIQLLRHWRACGAAMSIDVETTEDPATRCRLKAVSVSACGTTEAVAFPTGDELEPRLREQLLAELQAILGDPHCQVIGHNFITFDSIVLERYGMPTNGYVWDTLVLAHVLDPDIDHDLGFVAQDLLDTDPWKRAFKLKEKGGEATLTDLLYYNGRDAIAPQRFLQPLLQELYENELLLTAQCQTAWADIAREMELTGIWIDPEEFARLKRDRELRRDFLLHRIADRTGWPELTTFTEDKHGKRHYFINKPAVKRELLYERLRLPVTKYTPKKAEAATSAKAILDHLANPVVQDYVEWTEVRDDLNRTLAGYGKRIDLDGRLRPSWNPMGTVGSRFSSSPNVQNAADRMRAIFAAPPGRCLVGADEEQLEYRISAAFAGCKPLLKAFADGVDAHMLTTRAVFKERCDQVTKDVLRDLRYICKRVIYALNYGAGAERIAASIKEDKRTPMGIRAEIDEERVSDVIQGIFRAYPEIPRWRTGVLDFANTHGYLKIPPLGRKRIFASTPVEATKAWNWPVQVCAGDIFNLCLLKLRERLPENAHIILHGHDSAVVECDEKDAEAVAKAEEECLEYRLEGPAGGVRLFAKAHIGKNYAELH